MSRPLLELTFPRRKRALIFAMLASCFAVWGLLNGMTDNLVPAFQRIFTMNQAQAGLVQVAFYGAYAVLAIFASVLVEEFSYRIGLLIGLGIYVIGALLYVPACLGASFELYFIAIFTVAAGCSLLETTCNPYVLSFGDPETAVRRLNLAQAFNPVGLIAGVALARGLILAHLDPATAAERTAMAPEKLKEIVSGELFWICIPYLALCALVFAIWLFFLRMNPFMSTWREKRTSVRRVLTAGGFSVVPLLTLYFLFPGMDKVTWVLLGMLGPVAYLLVMPDYRRVLLRLLVAPRYVLGVVTLFCYVGAQVAVWTWFNAYCQKEMGVTPGRAAEYFLLALVLFIGFRWVATAAMRRVRPAALMAVFAVGGVAACLGTMYGGSAPLFSVGGYAFPANVLSLIAISGCMSLMFPTIYGIALERIDPEAVRVGAAGLIMSILGGAIVTPWMGRIIGAKASPLFALVPGAEGAWDANLMTSDLALRTSFVVPAICFAVVLAYALAFVRKTARDGEKA